MKTNLLRMVFCILILSGCQLEGLAPGKNPKPEPLITRPSPVTTTPTATIPTQTLTPGETKPPIKNLPQTPVTLTLTPDLVERQKALNLIYQCTSIEDEKADNLKNLPGTLVLQDSSIRLGSYLYTFSSSTKVNLDSFGRQYVYPLVVSPGQAKLAYQVSNYDSQKKRSADNLIVIIDGKGQVIKQIAISGSDERLTSWVDDDRIITSFDNSETPILMGVQSVISVVNLKTGERNKLPSDFPNIYSQFAPIPTWGLFTPARAVYSPSLRWVIFPSLEGKKPSLIDNYGTEIQTQSVVLWDLKEKKPVTHVWMINFDYEDAPVWSPDGTKFILSAPAFLNDDPRTSMSDDILMVSSDGKIERLTYLSSAQRVHFRNYNWSPDGRFVAFWLSIDPYPGYRLAVLDVAHKTIKDFCLEGEDKWGNPEPAPIWSPDARYLAFASNIRGSNVSTRSVLLDLLEGKAISIAEKLIPIGWMKDH